MNFKFWPIRCLLRLREFVSASPELQIMVAIQEERAPSSPGPINLPASNCIKNLINRLILTNQVWRYNCFYWSYCNVKLTGWFWPIRFDVETIVKSYLIGQKLPVNLSNSLDNWALESRVPQTMHKCHPHIFYITLVLVFAFGNCNHARKLIIFSSLNSNIYDFDITSCDDPLTQWRKKLQLSRIILVFS